MSRAADFNVLVTGATGFVGRHVVSTLLDRGCKVRAVARGLELARQMPWFEQVEFVAADLHDPALDVAALVADTDALLHLAWPGLPNYRALFHFEQNLPNDYHFIKRAVVAGVRQVMVTGTCFEYGLQSGALDETLPAQPVTAYGVAKHSLRLYLQALQREQSFTLQWARLFYLHGPGQASNSLLASLDRAIDEGHSHFDMSAGEQLRDYLPVQTAAAYLASVLLERQLDGVFNCCSGQPISVRTLVERRLRERSSSLQLNLGRYGYSAHEPMAFWGVRRTLDQLLGANTNVA